MRRLPLFALLALLGLLAGCDSAALEEETPTASFDAVVTGPVQATISGTAAWGDDAGSDFENGAFLTFNFPFSPRSLTSVVLLAEDGDDFHTLMFSFFDRRGPEEGTYALADPVPLRESDDALLLANYARQDDDLFQFFPISAGAVEVTTATEDRLAGTFRLEAEQGFSLTEEELEELAETFENGFRPGDELPSLPELEELEEPLMIEGSFNADRAERPTTRD